MQAATAATDCSMPVSSALARSPRRRRRTYTFLAWNLRAGTNREMSWLEIRITPGSPPRVMAARRWSDAPGFLATASTQGHFRRSSQSHPRGRRCSPLFYQSRGESGSLALPSLSTGRTVPGPSRRPSFHRPMWTRRSHRRILFPPASLNIAGCCLLAFDSRIHPASWANRSGEGPAEGHARREKP